MSDGSSEKPESYVQRVTDQARLVARELLEENERLRHRAITLERDSAVQRAELHALRQELATHRFEADRLAGALADTEQENQRFLARYLEVEREVASLAQLYVASSELHRAVEPQAVLTAIRDILANLVGCEHFGVYELGESDTRLELVTGMGLDGGSARDVRADEGAGAEVMRAGALWLASDAAPVRARDGAVGWVPLRLGAHVRGVVALYGLLPQKHGFEAIDREVLELLGRDALPALDAARLRRERSTRLATDGRASATTSHEAPRGT